MYKIFTLVFSRTIVFFSFLTFLHVNMTVVKSYLFATTITVRQSDTAISALCFQWWWDRSPLTHPVDHLLQTPAPGRPPGIPQWFLRTQTHGWHLHLVYRLGWWPAHVSVVRRTQLSGKISTLDVHNFMTCNLWHRSKVYLQFYSLVLLYLKLCKQYICLTNY